MLDLPVMNWQARSPKPEQHSPFSMFCKDKAYRYSNWRRILSHNSLFFQITSVSSEELALPRLIRCELPRLRCHGHSLFLSSYLCKVKRKENSSCSAYGHYLQHLTPSFWIVPHLSLSGALSLALLLPFLTSSSDLGA